MKSTEGGGICLKKLTKHLEWKAEELLKRIRDLEARLTSWQDAPAIYLKRRELTKGHRILLSRDNKHFHTIRDAAEMAEARMIQEMKQAEVELETLRWDLAQIERFLKNAEADDIESLLARIPKVYRELPAQEGLLTNEDAGDRRGSDHGKSTGTGARGGTTRDLTILAGGGASSSDIFYTPGSEAELDDETWVSINSRRNPKHPEHLIVSTTFGLVVRSKSEMLIAEYLHRNGLVFRYEPEIILNDSGNAFYWYPDFEIRIDPWRSIFWEHDGRMKDDDYVAGKLYTMRVCFENGIYISSDLIVTMEDETRPLDINDVIAYIGYLKNQARIPKVG